MRISDWSSDVCSSDLYKPLRRAHRLSAVVSALGASMLIENGIMLIWGPNVSVFPSDLLPNITWHIGGAYLSFLHNRKGVVLGKSGSVCVDLGGCPIFTKKT